MSKQELQKIKKEKTDIKELLFKNLWPAEKSRIPLLLIFDSKDSRKHLEMHELTKGLMVLPIKVIVVSSNEPPDLVKHPTAKINWVSNEEGRLEPKVRDYIKAADMAVVLDEHLDLMEKLMENGGGNCRK